MTGEGAQTGGNSNVKSALSGRLAIFVFIVFLALVFWSSVALQDLFFSSVGAVSLFVEANRFAGLAIFVVLAALSSMLSLFSSVPLVPISVMVFGDTPTIFLLLLGWVIGDTIAYLIGVAADRTLLRRLVNYEKVNYYKNKLSARSQFWMVVIFRLALPAEVTGYPLGILRYPFGKYILAVLISELPFAVLAVYSSDAFVEGRFFVFAALVALGAVSAYFLFRLFKSKIRKGNE